MSWRGSSLITSSWDFNCLLCLDVYFSRFGKTSAVISLNRLFIPFVFISALLLAYGFLGLVSWLDLRILVCCGHVCLFVFPKNVWLQYFIYFVLFPWCSFFCLTVYLWCFPLYFLFEPFPAFYFLKTNLNYLAQVFSILLTILFIFWFSCSLCWLFLLCCWPSYLGPGLK